MPHNKDHLIDFLVGNSITSPDKSAYIILTDGEMSEKKISYASLTGRMMATAAALRSKGLKGQRVLLIYQDILEFIVCFLACQYAGIVPIPVPYAKGNKQLIRLRSIIEDAQVAAILCVNDSIEDIQGGFDHFLASRQLQLITTDLLPVISATDLQPQYDDIAFIQYTSGSTGNPKGVVVTGKNLVHNQAMIKETFKCQVDSVIFSWLPFHHDMGLIGNILHSIYTGATCILMSPLHFMQRPQRWLEGIARYKATHSGGPNFAYDLSVDKITPEAAERLDLSGWQVAYNGSEPIRAFTIERFTDRFKLSGFNQKAFYPCYGLAEATLLVTGIKNAAHPAHLFINRGLTGNDRVVLSEKPGPFTHTIVSSGRPPLGIAVKIFSRHDGSVCGELEEGEIGISGNSVTKGYWDKSSEALFYLSDNRMFLKTGDIGFLYKNELFVHGRMKETLIIRGVNIYPADVEQILAGCDKSIEPHGVVLFSIDDHKENYVVVAEVRRSAVAGLQADDLILTVDKKSIGEFGIEPYDIVLITPLGIPRTTSGKLQRLKCKDNYLCGGLNIIASKLAMQQRTPAMERDGQLLTAVITTGNYEAVRRYLIDVMTFRLGRLPGILSDDAIELTSLGIDSLRGTEIVNIIGKELMINVDAAEMFRDNTFSGLITEIENKLWLRRAKNSGEGIAI